MLRYRQPAEPRTPKERVFEYPAAEGQRAFRVVRKLDVPADRPGKERFYVVVDGKRVKTALVPEWCKGVVYRLDELQRALIDEPLFWCEGEKDVEALRDGGFSAVTTSYGAHHYKPAVARHFTGRWVVILPDNDDVGRHCADRVAASLRGVAAKVEVIRLPGLGHKGDVSDWLANGGKVKVPDFFKPTRGAARPADAENGKAAELGTIEAAILAAIDRAEHRSLTTDRLPMLIAGLAGEEAWNARAHEPIIRYRDVPKAELAKARAGISRALGSLLRRGLIAKSGRRVRRAQKRA